MPAAAALDSLASEVRRRPDDVARLLLDADPESASVLVQALERRLSAEPLKRLERVWQLSGSQAAELFGVSRQAYAKWRRAGVPADRRADVADLDAATQELPGAPQGRSHPCRRWCRRSAADLAGRSLLEVAAEEGASSVREAVRRTFDLRRVQP